MLPGVDPVGEGDGPEPAGGRFAAPALPPKVMGFDVTPPSSADVFPPEGGACSMMMTVEGGAAEQAVSDESDVTKPIPNQIEIFISWSPRRVECERRFARVSVCRRK